MNNTVKLFASLLVATSLSACTVLRGESDLGHYVDDSDLTLRVKQKLVQNDQVSATRIYVETNSGNVILSGFVKNQTQADVALKAAQSTHGVKKVYNKLVIMPNEEQK